MVGHSKSDTKKAQICWENHDAYMDKAEKAYREEMAWPLGEKRKGLRTICKELEKECLMETHQEISLDKTTLSRRVRGITMSLSQSNEDKGWLTTEEWHAVLAYMKTIAYRGFPLSLRRITEHVNEICWAHYRPDSEFPAKGVGQNWAKRFVEKHSDEIKAFWSHPLDHSHACAVNPYTKEEFFKLLEAVIEGDGGDDIIPPKLIYGTDETGIQQGIGVKERVYGPQGAKIQHQQRSGDRENITVITTICADGTWVAPAVIFKGEGYETSWKQNNPLKMLWVKECNIDIILMQR